LLVLSLTFFQFQCSQPEKPKKIDPAFAGYISALTRGVVSNNAKIKVRLTEPVADAVPGSTADKTLFDFSPAIEGTAYWTDSQTIEFRPAVRLAPGRLYEARFFLSKIKKVPEKLKTLVFGFQVRQQALDVTFGGVESYDTYDLKWQMIKGQVISFDVADGDNIEHSVTVTQNGKSLPVFWEHSADEKIHTFRIDSVKRTENIEQVIVQWNGKLLGFEGGKEKVFEIPPLGEFKVIEANFSQQQEQQITVYFSDPIDKDVDLEGLVYVKPATKLKIVREVNALKIFPETRINGDVTLFVTTGIKNSMGYALKEEFQKSYVFKSLKPAIELIGKGSILPGSAGMRFPFRAVNLSAVDVKVIRIFEDNVAQFLQVNQFDGTQELKRVGRIIYKGEVPLKSDKAIDYGNWNNFSVDLSRLINAEPGAIYRVQLSFRRKQSLYPCDTPASNDDSYDLLEEDKEESSYDQYSYDWYYDDEYYDGEEYNYQEREDPCKSSYYRVNGRAAGMNILASNLGIIAKGGSGTTMNVAITNLITTDPLSGVKVDIYNFQNQLMGSQTTDNDGLLQIDLTKKPYLLVASKGKERGYLRLDDGSALSLSMFDIGGQQVQKGVKGLIYGERGVWRPGDSLYVTFVLEDKNHILPVNHPAVFELYTPEQQLYSRKIKTASVNGFYDFRTATTADAPTGNWLAKVKLGGSVFTKTIKIETVKPNRLKINLDFHTPFLTDVVKPKGDLEVKWLHGAIASGLRADIEMNLTRGSTNFSQYAGYVFDDPSKEFSSEDKKIFEGTLDQNGKAVISPDIQINNGAPGMLQVNLKLRAFEKGGDFSVDRFSIPYSPYRGYVGLKIPEGNGWNGALYSNEPNLIPIVTVDESGNPVDRKGVKIEIYNVYWRWWWEHSDEDGLAQYVSNPNSYLMQTATIDTKNGKAMFEMNLNGDYYGRKFIRVTDPVTGHSCGQSFYVTYKGWWSGEGGENPGGAEMLTFSTDKKSYAVGEKMKVSIPASGQGRTLVSVESGSRVLKTFWVKMNEGITGFELEATPEMAPNVYIHLTLIQPHDNIKNDLPIRLYGVQPVTVENPETHLFPVIRMPEVLEPEKKFTVKVSEQHGHKMTYTLAIVDEGLLDLTRFKTPDPWSHFYAKEALSVHTWDMYKYVLGAFTGEMAGLLALGGDESSPKNGGAKANRFKPAVMFIGPFTIEPNGTGIHSIQMPNYVGSVRTMVVSGFEGAYGSAEKTTPVKKPLMVLATMPRVIGPGEKTELPVTVFAMDNNVKDVTVEVQTNELLGIKDEKTKTLHFDRPGDQVLNFNLIAASKPGIGRIKIISKSGNQTATYDIEIDVRTANPRVTDIVSGVIEPGETWTGTYKAVGMEGTNHGIAEVSSIPPIKLRERLQYLITYPHGCIEQTTSAVFPQLFLSSLMQLDANEKRNADENIKAGINRLKTFQIYSGGMSYWPGETETASDWGTSYAGHFMLEAKNKGYALPPGFLESWIKFQKRRANSWSADQESGNWESSEIIQAYRLYTLALAKAPELGAMNRLRSKTNLSVAAKWRLAAAYYLAGKTEVASKMVDNITTDIAPYKELSYSYGSRERDKAMILETLVMLGNKQEAKTILDELGVALSSSRWYSTQTTAYSLLAIAKFVGVTGTDDNGLAYEYKSDNGTTVPYTSTAPLSQFKLSVKTDKPGNIQIHNTGKKTLFVKLQLDGIPPAGDATSAENSLGITVRYLSLDGKEIDPAILEQGTDFVAEVKISHPGIREDYKEMALTQIFPSGWEIRNMRLEEWQSADKADIPRYQDIRDDRVLSYFDINRGAKKTFRVILNASYIGEFYLPTVYCEAMYDNDINGRRAGKWVKVVTPGKQRGVAQ